MNDYIVRICRDEKEHPRSVIGIVETLGSGEKETFINIEVLWEILNPRKEGRTKEQT
jgi:hypothetical protein